MAEAARPVGVPVGVVMRLLAGVYDAMIVFSLNFLAFIPITLIEAYGGTAPVWLKSLVIVTITYAYFVGFWVKSGATTGMRPWKLKIAMADSGDPVSLAAATMRFVGMLVTAICLGLPMITIFFTRQRQSLHDLLAGTSVYRVQPPPPGAGKG